MNWLIWKEYRLQRLVLVVGAFLFVVPYTFPAYAWTRGAPATQPALAVAAIASILMSILTLSLLGGNSIASERLDRSAEYLSYQPISRWQILCSKLIFPVSAVVVIWSINLVVLASTDRWQMEILYTIIPLAIAALCAFGVSWLVSSCQSSPTFATASGFVAPLALITVINLILWLARLQTPRAIGIAFVILATSVGLLSFAGGIWHYVRRVEP